MSIFNKIAREDGFYAGNICKIVDGEKRNLIIIIFFFKEFIFFQMEQVDAPLLVNQNFILDLKDQHHKLAKAIQTGEVKEDDFPKEMAKYTETIESLRANFFDGTDDVKLTLLPRLFNGVLMYLELEGYKVDWLYPDNSGIKKRKIIDGEKVNFFVY